jgi:hypothetical protein
VCELFPLAIICVLLMRALKSHDMKTNFTQQEILLITDTSFSHREWSKKDDPEIGNNLTDKDQLEEACWNGLLQDMLPEIYEKPGHGKKLYLWQTRQGKSFIDIELGEIPVKKENYFSIDPYSFLPGKLHN